MESHLASTSTSTAFSTTNLCRLIRERLESHFPSNYHRVLGTQTRSNQRQGSGFYSAGTTSNSFTNISNIFNVTLSPTKVPDTGYSLWPRHCCCMGINDLISAARNSYKYIWEVILCMVLIGRGRLGTDIWPKISQQAKSTKSIMRVTWNTEKMCRQKASGRLDFSLSPTSKKSKHVHALLFCDCWQLNSWFEHRF